MIVSLFLTIGGGIISDYDLGIDDITVSCFLLVISTGGALFALVNIF